MCMGLSFCVVCLCCFRLPFARPVTMQSADGTRRYQMTYYVVIPRSDHVLSFNTHQEKSCLFLCTDDGAGEAREILWLLQTSTVKKVMMDCLKGGFFTNRSLSANECSDCVSVAGTGFKIGVSNNP